MEELKQILREHASFYPLMEPIDAVKLIYQNEFGGGHLIRDEAACLNYLRREYASIEKDAAADLYERIGNGIVRVNLASLSEEMLEQLGRAFIRGAAARQGDLSCFLAKLEVLKELTEEGIFSFDPDALDAYLADYAQLGYPAVSHSQRYRDAYKPAYRIVPEK